MECGCRHRGSATNPAHPFATIKQHLAAIRRLFDWLVVGQVVPWNPTAAVRGPTHIVKRGKTPVLQPWEVRLLVDSIDTSTVGGLRDQALLGVMIYSFARVSAVVHMDVEDYYLQGKRRWLRLREKGGKQVRLAGPPQGGGLSRRLSRGRRDRGRARLAAVAHADADARARRTPDEQGGRLPDGQAPRQGRRARGRGELPHVPRLRDHGVSPHGGTLERAQAIAGHESPRTTQLYDRTAADITVEDIERIKM